MTQAEVLKRARMRAMLRLIRWLENEGASDYRVYHARIGNRDPMTDKEMSDYVPKAEYFKDADGEIRPHYATGAYQIIRDTWNRVSTKLGIRDFTPVNQDRVAMFLIEERHATGDREAGDLQHAIQRLNQQWTSLPGGTQDHIRMEDTRRKYQIFVNEELKRTEDGQSPAKP